MSLALDVALFMRNSKTKLGLNLSNECILYKLAFRIGSNSNTWVSQETLARECGVHRQNLTEPLKKLTIAGILIIKKNKKDRRKNTYSITDLIKNYVQMTDAQKKRAHELLVDNYAPADANVSGKPDVKNLDVSGKPDVNMSGKPDAILKSKTSGSIENKGLSQNEKSPKGTYKLPYTNKESISGSFCLSTIPDDFFPDDENLILLREHADRTNNTQDYLLNNFFNICKKYKIQRLAHEWQHEFKKMLEREMPKKTYEDVSGKRKRYDGQAIYN